MDRATLMVTGVCVSIIVRYTPYMLGSMIKKDPLALDELCLAGVPPLVVPSEAEA